MNKETHRTVTITAEMHIPYSIEINVPSHIENDDVWELLVRDGHIDGGDMLCDDNDVRRRWGGDWTWGDVHDQDFNPDADDYSECLPKDHKCDRCSQYMYPDLINDNGVCGTCEEKKHEPF